MRTAVEGDVSLDVGEGGEMLIEALNKPPAPHVGSILLMKVRRTLGMAALRC